MRLSEPVGYGGWQTQQMAPIWWCRRGCQARKRFEGTTCGIAGRATTQAVPIGRRESSRCGGGRVVVVVVVVVLVVMVRRGGE